MSYVFCTYICVISVHYTLSACHNGTHIPGTQYVVLMCFVYSCSKHIAYKIHRTLYIVIVFGVFYLFPSEIHTGDLEDDTQSWSLVIYCCMYFSVLSWPCSVTVKIHVHLLCPIFMLWCFFFSQCFRFL